jgi:hypothetical protein
MIATTGQSGICHIHETVMFIESGENHAAESATELTSLWKKPR